MASATARAKELLAILRHDRDERLLRIDDYIRGDHDDPYMPPNCDEEYRLLAKRAVFNVIPLAVNTPVQGMYVDGFRRGGSSGADTSSQTSPEWEHWQRSRLDARQKAVHTAAVGYGHSFTLTEMKGEHAITTGLSSLRTAGLYEDPANDLAPRWALTVDSFPHGDDPGIARMWSETDEFNVLFKDMNGEGLVVEEIGRHGASECPVTRFAADIDLEGRTTGVVWPLIALNNRINQTVFDLLVAQTYGSFKVRWATGMAPPMQMEPVYENPDDPSSEIIDWKPKIGDNGQPLPAPMDLNARRFLFGEDDKVKFGTLDGTPLDGYINSIEMSVRHFSATSNTPPHYLLGQIANLSAEALMAAETSLQRLITQFQASFGESWERVFRIAAELEDRGSVADDFGGEVIWRDMESRSLAQAADGLGKLRTQVEAPAKGLWKMIPGMTDATYDEWVQLAEEEDSQRQLADAIRGATPSSSGPPPRPDTFNLNGEAQTL